MPHVGETRFVDALRTEAESRPHMLCSVYPRAVSPSHWTNGGGYHIPAAKPDQGYSFCMIGPGEHRYDLGDNRFFISKDISSADMARDVIGISRARKFFVPETGEWVEVPERKESQWTRMGLFVPEGDKPTKEEISAARAKLVAYMNEKLMEGDGEFQRSGNPRHVEEISRIAAEFLGAKRPWYGQVGDTQEQMQCPACKDQINKTATRCKHCNARIGYTSDGTAFEIVATAPSQGGQAEPVQVRGR